jgi:hypothetical protein
LFVNDGSLFVPRGGFTAIAAAIPDHIKKDVAKCRAVRYKSRVVFSIREGISMTRNEELVPASQRPLYTAPTIRTLTENEVLEEVGPAQAYTGSVPFQF